jgi:hypothetical protein
MASRYTKSIPTEIYFTKVGNGWYGGPYVHPPKAVDQLIVCKIVNISVRGNVKKSKSTDKIALNAELLAIEKWLKSEEGKQTLRDRMKQVDEIDKVIDSMNDISLEDLRRPFNI